MSIKWEAKNLEAGIETKLQTFAAFLSRQDQGDWIAIDQVDAEIKSSIDQLSDLLETMESTVDKKVVDDYLRHVSDYNREYLRIKNLLNQAKEREDLMASIQKDIRESRNDDQAYLLDERVRIDKSRNMADEILEQAMYARDDLGRQRSMIFDGRSRLGNTIGILRYFDEIARFPLLNSLMSKIRFRKTRDVLIMSVLIGGGFCFFIWYFLM